MIRNYRQISRTDAAGLALGGSSCRAVRDKIKFRLLAESFTGYDSIPILMDSIIFYYDPEAPRFVVTDKLMHPTVTEDFNYDEEAPRFAVVDELMHPTDDIDYEEE